MDLSGELVNDKTVDEFFGGEAEKRGARSTSLTSLPPSWDEGDGIFDFDNATHTAKHLFTDAIYVLTEAQKKGIRGGNRVTIATSFREGRAHLRIAGTTFKVSLANVFDTHFVEVGSVCKLLINSRAPKRRSMNKTTASAKSSVEIRSDLNVNVPPPKKVK